MDAPLRSHNFRTDIEGLRAVAILLVIAFHAHVPGVSGGFAGVDIFFVLSGYLITALLVQERETKGRIDLVQFYARRARRLLPGVVLLLIVTMIASYIILSPIEQRVVAYTTLSTALYVSNFLFAHTATVYDAPQSVTNPLLHTWSLAVEEQFYLVWPALLILATRRRVGRALPIVLSLVTALSFAFALKELPRMTSWAFFGSPSRAWEFGIGGLTALVPRVYLERRRTAVAVLTVMGGLAILAAGTLLTSRALFPGPVALLPVLGTAAVLLGGAAQPEQHALRLLRTRPMQWLGRLSYSWYLWHWPVLVLAGAYLGPSTTTMRVVLSIGALGLAWLAHTLVENRVRYSASLMRRPWVSLGAGVAATIVVAGTAAAWRMRIQQIQASGIQGRFIRALHDRPRIYTMPCYGHTDTSTSNKACIFGDTASKTTAVLFGDSHAAHWIPAMERIAEARHWRLIVYTRSGCPAARVIVPFVPPYPLYTGCGAWRDIISRQIVALKPDYLFVSNSASYVDDTTKILRMPIAREEWRDGLLATLQRVAPAVQRRTVVISDVPWARVDIPACLSRAAWHGVAPERCAFSRSDGVDTLLTTQERAVAAQVPRASWVSFTDALCSAQTCAAEQDGYVVYRDDNHLTASFSAHVAPTLWALIAKVVTS